MNTHYRNYAIFVNGKQLPFFLEIEAISNCHIENAKQTCIDEQKVLGRIKDGDDVKFMFKYCNT